MYLVLFHTDGNPGDVEFFSPDPLSQTELEMIWYPPELLGTSDPLLLRYKILYTTDSVLESGSEVVEEIIPQIDGTGVMLLKNLTVGTTYVIGVVATSMATVPKVLPKLNFLVSTYGKGR